MYPHNYQKSNIRIKIIHNTMSIIVGIILNFIAGSIIWFFVGLIGTYIIILFILLLIQKINGGVLDRKTANEIAQEYLENFKEVIQKVYPEKNKAEHKKIVMKIIQKIAKQSIALGMDYTKYFIFSSLSLATANLIEMKDNKDEKEIYKTILLQMVEYIDGIENLTENDFIISEDTSKLFYKNQENIEIPFGWIKKFINLEKPSILSLEKLEQMRMENDMNNEEFANQLNEYFDEYPNESIQTMDINFVCRLMRKSSEEVMRQCEEYYPILLKDKDLDFISSIINNFDTEPDKLYQDYKTKVSIDSIFKIMDYKATCITSFNFINEQAVECIISLGQPLDVEKYYSVEAVIKVCKDVFNRLFSKGRIKKRKAEIVYSWEGYNSLLISFVLFCNRGLKKGTTLSIQIRDIELHPMGNELEKMYFSSAKKIP